MALEPKISLDCPYCGHSIYAGLSWFKQACSTCPACAKQLTDSQFAAIIFDLEQAMAASIEERVSDGLESGCCGEHSSCCGGHS